MFYGSEAEAMEQLHKCEADLEAYAAERGLTMKVDPMYPGQPLPGEQPGPVKFGVWSLLGRMPGGTVGRLRHQASFGEVMGTSVRGNHTVFVSRQPETVAYVPLLGCRPDEFASGLFEWAGDGRKRQEQKFESLELDRRFVIEIAPGQEQQWLYRLFTPALIDWLAHETPPDFGFKLSSGSFSCEVPQWRGQHRVDGQVDPEHLDRVASCGGRVSGRIRDEVLEQVGLGNVPKPRSAEANRNWSKGKRSGWIINTLLKVTGGENDDSARDFALAHGFETAVDPAEFHAAHIRLPLPAAGTDVFAGKLNDGRDAHLVWLEYESEYYGIRYYVGLVADVGREGPDIWFDEEEVQATVDLPGAELPDKAVEIARELDCGISTGGGAAAVYISSTGWEGRPGAGRIEMMTILAPMIFDALEADGTKTDSVQSV